MSSLLVHGGQRLCGTVTASGAKNAALPILAAAILADEPVELVGVPRLTDVDTMLRLLAGLGVASNGVCVPWDLWDLSRGPARQAGPTGAWDLWDLSPDFSPLSLHTIDPTAVRAPDRLVRRMRASFCVLGPLLARRGKAIVPLPGGCRIGDRPVDVHLRGLAALGADVRIEHGCVCATARRLRGATIDVRGPRGPSVTGTANLLCAATLARGETTLVGAACEPEIVDLGQFLTTLGARIEGLGTSTIHVRGVAQLGGGRHTVIPDRIEAGTLLIAAAATGGDVTVLGTEPAHLAAVLSALADAGAEVEILPRAVRVIGPARPRPLQLRAAPFPGLPTDLQAQLTALCSIADGQSLVADAVFPMRFQHLAELRRLGADLQWTPDGAVVHGVGRLTVARVRATDLRASAALVIAALVADGVTQIDRIAQLDRGYEGLDHKLRALGATIDRVSVSSVRKQALA